MCKQLLLFLIFLTCRLAAAEAPAEAKQGVKAESTKSVPKEETVETLHKVQIGGKESSL